MGLMSVLSTKKPISLVSSTKLPYYAEALPEDYSNEQMNRFYECGGYAKANESSSESSHLRMYLHTVATCCEG